MPRFPASMQEVELMADCKVKGCLYGHRRQPSIRSFNSNGMVAIRDKEVSPMDVDRVIETARCDADSGRSGDPAS